MKKRVIIIGSYPPPYGGISVHIERLYSELSSYFEIRIVDLYGEKDKGNIKEFLYTCGSKRPFNLLNAVRYLSKNEADIIHFHVSAMGNFAIAGFFLLWSSSKQSTKLITIHSGSFVQQYRGSGRLRQMIIRRLLRAFDHVVSVNAENKELLRELKISEEHISVIPAFLPPIAERSIVLEQEIAELRNGARRILLVSGSARKYYGFHLVLEAIDSMGALRNELAIIFIFYHSSDSGYVSSLRRSLDRGVPYRIFRDLSPGEFSFLLSNIDIYVRPTDRDGDSVALREAIYYGKKVIASDCVKRPPGVALFEAGCVDSLREAIENTVHNAGQGISSFDVAESRDRLFALYQMKVGNKKIYEGV